MRNEYISRKMMAWAEKIDCYLTIAGREDIEALDVWITLFCGFNEILLQLGVLQRSRLSKKSVQNKLRGSKCIW